LQPAFHRRYLSQLQNTNKNLQFNKLERKQVRKNY